MMQGAQRLKNTHVGDVRIDPFFRRAPMDDRHKDTWAGALLSLMFHATLLGGLLVLKLTLH